MHGSRQMTGALVVSLAALSGAPAVGQTKPAPTKEELARNNKLFIELAGKELKWEEPAEPLRRLSPLHRRAAPGVRGRIDAELGAPKTPPDTSGTVKPAAGTGR